MKKRASPPPALPSREVLLDWFAQRPHHSLPLHSILKQHRVAVSQRRAFRGLLDQLAQEGALIRRRGLHFQHAKPPSADSPTPRAVARGPLMIGRLWRHAEGFGFVASLPDGDQRTSKVDVFIGRSEMANALHGDLVEVSVNRTGAPPGGRGRTGGRGGRGRSGRGPSGRIVRIVERASARIIGRYQPDSRGGRLIPLDERVAPPLPVRSAPASIAAGSLVAGELSSAGDMAVRVVRDFGPGDTPKWDTDLVIEEFGLPVAFSAEAEREAAKFPATVSVEPGGRRRDLRARATVTIDGETARDFDDAISVERTAQGYRLWVHVADVGHYVPWDSALDQSARQRGTSVYFPDRAVPMLPERLSNDLCSLNPHVDRLTMTAEMELDRHGAVVNYDLYESVIRSDARLTYTGVAAALEGGAIDEPYRSLRPLLELAAEIADRLRQRRMARGSLDFDLPEPEIVLDLQGRPTDILKEARTVAHRLIEECMLAANETVAQYLTQKQAPLLYRIHEPPDPEKLGAFNFFAKGFGHPLPKGGLTGDSPAPLQTMLESLEGRPEQRLLNHLLLRSMKRARYGPEPLGHFGLASPCYTHFTSPIRRYPDLIVHRILKEVLAHDALPQARQKALAGLLPGLGLHASERERISMEAEWEVVKVKKARFMLERVGQTYRGHITGVSRHGVFVELEEMFVEGFVPLRALPRDQYRFDESRHALIGSHSHRYQLADPLTIVVEGVDLDRRRVNFILA